MSGAHGRLFPAVFAALQKNGAGDIPVLGGGIIPDEDVALLQQQGIVSVFTPGTPLSTIIEAFTAACHQQHQARTG